MQHLAPLLLAFQETAETPAPQGSPLGSSMIPILLIIGVFYLVLFLPEKKKKKARMDMLASLKKGDKVMTNSGLYGTVAKIQDDVVTLKVADDVRLRFNLAAIQDMVGEPAPAKEEAAEDKGTEDAKAEASA